VKTSRQYVLTLTPQERHTIEIALWLMLRKPDCPDDDRAKATALYDQIVGLVSTPPRSGG
jgi:hypothetical protein